MEAKSNKYKKIDLKKKNPFTQRQQQAAAASPAARSVKSEGSKRRKIKNTKNQRQELDEPKSIAREDEKENEKIFKNRLKHNTYHSMGFCWITNFFFGLVAFSMVLLTLILTSHHSVEVVCVGRSSPSSSTSSGSLLFFRSIFESIFPFFFSVS